MAANDKKTTKQTLERVKAWANQEFVRNTVNNLVNYYLKSETYTKAEVQQLLNAIKQFTYQVAPSLPTASADTMNVIYLVPTEDPKTKNVKDEFITIDNGAGAATRYTWEQIGSTQIDLSGYYTSAQTDAAITAALNSALANYTTTTNLNTLLGGKVDKVSGKGLSTNDYTNEEKAKLGELPTEAELNNEFVISGVYDVSAKNPTAGPNNDGKFTLDYILDSNNVNTLIPTAYRKGGMSIKFVQSSDNKYVQYRYIPSDATTVATFTNVANWQGVDKEIVAGSNNLAESGAVKGAIEEGMIANCPYLMNNSVFDDIVSASEFISAIKDFKMCIPKQEGYDYGIFKINNGLPEGATYAYNIVVFRYPSGETPSQSNVITVGSWVGSIPQNGVINISQGTSVIAKVTIDWSKFNTTFGSGTLMYAVGTSVRYNQQYIFSEYVLEKDIKQIFSELDYYTCSTNELVDQKTIDAPNYTLKVGGSIRVKFTHRHGNASQATLKVGTSAAKPIYYNGNPVVQMSYSWPDNAVVDFYYDGTNWVGKNAFEIFNFRLFNSGVDIAQNTLVVNSGFFVLSTGHITTLFSGYLDMSNVSSGYYILGFSTTSYPGVLTLHELTSTSVLPTAFIPIAYFNWDGSKATRAIHICKYFKCNGEYVENESFSSIQEMIAKINENVDFLNACALKRKIYNISDFHAGYTIGYNKNIGDVFNESTQPNPPSSSSGGQLYLSVKKGDVISVRVISQNNQYVQTWLILDTDKRILSWSGTDSVTFNWDTPHDFVIESDGYFVLQFVVSNYTDNVNLPLNVEHKYNVNVYDKLETQIEDLQEQIEGITPETIEVCIPDEVYAVAGSSSLSTVPDYLQLFYRSIFKCVDYSKYDINVECYKETQSGGQTIKSSVGYQYPRYYELLPSEAGTFPITFKIKDNNNNELGSKTSSLKTFKPALPSQDFNVLCLGASSTVFGQWASELKRRLTGTGGTPQATNLNRGTNKIYFVGRKDVIYNGQQVNFEATGGYNFASYTTIGTKRYIFRIDASNLPEVNVGNVYTSGSNSFTVVEKNMTNGYFSCDGTGAPTGNTLTLETGTGDATVTFNSYEIAGNPFVYNGSINMQQYADEYCNPQNAEHGTIDVVLTSLYYNGSRAYMTDFTSILNDMRTLINQFRTVFPNVKFGIGLPYNPDIRGGMGVDYGAWDKNGFNFGYGIKYSCMSFCNALQKYITDNELGDYVYIIDFLNEFDEENGFQQTSKALNTRFNSQMSSVNSFSDMTDTSKIYLLKEFSNGLTPGAYVHNGTAWIPKEGYAEIFGKNGVHPAETGYFQMSDAAYRLFIAKFCHE